MQQQKPGSPKTPEKVHKTSEEACLRIFQAWLDPKAQHGLTHNPKIMQSESKAVVPQRLPSTLPEIPELYSGCLPDPQSPFDMDITNGAPSGGHHTFLYHPHPMTPYWDMPGATGGTPLEDSDDPAQVQKIIKTGEGTPFLDKVKAGVFPKLAVEGGSLFDRLLRRDPEMLACVPKELGDPESVIVALQEAQGATAKPEADRYLKQIYFPLGDGTFHLLGIAPSSLMLMKAYQVIWDLRRRKRHVSSVEVSFGGTKPQNVGTLATRFKGVSLIPSDPPERHSSEHPYRQRSLFPKWTQRESVQGLFKELEAFLLTDPPRNWETRSRRDGYIGRIVEDLLVYQAQLRQIPGWTTSPQCLLSNYQKAWLDPEGVSDRAPEEDMTAICAEFAQTADRMLKRIPHGATERNLWASFLADILRERGLT